MVQFAYRNGNATNKLIFIFSADDFNQAYKRLKYIHEIAEYREYQVEQIKTTQEKIKEKISELEEKERKIRLKENKKLEFSQLQEDKVSEHHCIMN